MTNTLESFIQKKKDESSYITLDNGESVRVKLTEMKLITKVGFNGDEVEVMRYVVEVPTANGVKLKYFDNKTRKFAEEVFAKGIGVGDKFTLTREGDGPKTKYIISDVESAKMGGSTAPAQISVPTVPTVDTSTGEITEAHGTVPSVPAKKI